jgi:hypothetical protein
MGTRMNEMGEITAVLHDHDALSPESIHKTALDYLYRALCTIRACAQEDPYRAGEIADAFHNLPRILQSGDHQACRDETVRAACILKAPRQTTTTSPQELLEACNAGHGLAISPPSSAHKGLDRLQRVYTKGDATASRQSAI